MSVTATRRLAGGFRTDRVLFTMPAVTPALIGHPIFLGMAEPMTGR